MSTPDYLSIRGPDAVVTVERDAWGIAHVTATSENDAWFGMGFASAQDRLWQMEYDRRRACGRWSEAAGPAGLAADIMARRLRLEDSARADVAAMSPDTTRMFEAYRDGVNAYLESCPALPPEYALTGLKPEPWEVWHSVASFKIRHVLMGTWHLELAQGIFLARVGPETFSRLDVRPPSGSPVTVPPGATMRRLYEESGEELAAAANHLGFLAETEAGSNAWVVAGSRTTTGKPVLCNDSHRALDVPNVYWQVLVACPAFDVAGGTFPGSPGFPHFGHNGHVAWAITHAGADTQDLYIERFEGNCYHTPGGLQSASHRTETIEVRGGEPVTIDTWATGHGPVVHGDPGSGHALALRYTALDGPCRQFECLRPMLSARTVEDLLETQRGWVDPVNNLVTADTAGNIGYLLRGMLPKRSGVYRQIPIPGWTGEHEWTGMVPFEHMPRSVNPPEGFIATSNQEITGESDLYVARVFAEPARIQRIVELITSKPSHSPDDLAAMQADMVSVNARRWVTLIAGLQPPSGPAGEAWRMLRDWDANLRPHSAEALLYSCFRRAVARRLFEPLVGAQAWDWLVSAQIPLTLTMITLWLANVLWAATENGDEEERDRVLAALPDALEDAWRAAEAMAGPDPRAWWWSAYHRTAAAHPLSAVIPHLRPDLDPPRVGIGGDADCLQRASYTWKEARHFDILALSVYRQVVDLSDMEHATSVVPGGVSGVPGSPHYTDQLELWRSHHRVPMISRERSAP